MPLSASAGYNGDRISCVLLTTQHKHCKIQRQLQKQCPCFSGWSTGLIELVLLELYLKKRKKNVPLKAVDSMFYGVFRLILETHDAVNFLNSAITTNEASSGSHGSSRCCAWRDIHALHRMSDKSFLIMVAHLKPTVLLNVTLWTHLLLRDPHESSESVLLKGGTSSSLPTLCCGGQSLDVKQFHILTFTHSCFSYELT